MKIHTFFFLKLGKMSHNLSSAAVVIGTLRVNVCIHCDSYFSVLQFIFLAVIN